MRLGIFTNIDLLADAAAADYDYAELSAASTLAASEDEAAFRPTRDRILAAPIPVEAFNCFLPGQLKVVGPDVDLQAVRSYMDVALRRAAEVGASIVVFGAGGSRRTPEGFPIDRAWKQLDEAARLAGEFAAQYGLTIAMEPLFKRSCNYFNRVDQGAEFVDRVNHPSLKLLADLFHVAAEEEPLENIVRAGSRLAHAHIPTPAIPETGEGFPYDFDGFFAALAKAGYDGRISVEDNNGLLGGKEPLVNAYRAVRECVLRSGIKA